MDGRESIHEREAETMGGMPRTRMRRAIKAKKACSIALCALLTAYLIPTGAWASDAVDLPDDAEVIAVPDDPSEEEGIEYFNSDEAPDQDDEAVQGTEVGSGEGAEDAANGVIGSDEEEQREVEGDQEGEEAPIIASLPTEGGVVTIKAGGAYELAEGAVGKIVIDTAEAVQISGQGCAIEADGSITSPCTPVWIDATSTPGANLTLRDLYMYVDADTRSESASYAGNSVIAFAGEGNHLQIEGNVAIEYDMPDAAEAPIHVPADAELAIVGHGKLFLSSPSNGAVIGGNAGEANGAVSFGDHNEPDLSVYVKGSGKGAVIGQGADVVDAVVPGEISFVGAKINLIANGPGPALGGASDQAAFVRLKQRAQVAINVEDEGAAVQLPSGSLVSEGGSFRIHVDGTSKWALEGSPLLADVVNMQDSAVCLCEFDTGKVWGGSEPYTVLVDDVATYHGGLHADYYAQEAIDDGMVDSAQISYVTQNWISGDADAVIPLYLTGEDHVLTVNGQSFRAIWDEEAEAFQVSSDLFGTAAIALFGMRAVVDQGVTPAYTGENGTVQVEIGNAVTRATPNNADPAPITAKAGDEVKITATPPSGSYIAQVRWATVPKDTGADAFVAAPAASSGDESDEGEGSEEGDDDPDSAEAPELAALDVEGGAEEGADAEGDEDEAEAPLSYAVLATPGSTDEWTGTLTIPEDCTDSIRIVVDFVPVVWDGTIDLTWYNARNSSFQLQYAAQFEGAAALINGIFTCYPVTSNDLGPMAPDYEAYKKAMGVTAGNPAGELYGEFSSTYNLIDTQMGTTSWSAAAEHTQRVIGDASLLVANHGVADMTGSANKVTSTVYYYGAEDFTGKTLNVTADLDFGGITTGGKYDPVASPLFMSLGGAYSMAPQVNDTNGYAKISSWFNGNLDGGGHAFNNVYAERYASGGNYGDSADLGIVGQLGANKNDVVAGVTQYALNPTVRRIILESGYMSGRRAIGGIVGSTGVTTASQLHDGSLGAVIEYCINKARVFHTDTKGAAGICASSYNSGVIRYCANFGEISGSMPSPTGGISAYNEMKILNCYNVGKVYAGGSTYGMGIATMSMNTSYVENCWYLNRTAQSGGYFIDQLVSTSGHGADPFDDGGLTASMVNPAGLSIWMDDATGINSYDGCNYPILFFQSSDFDGDEVFVAMADDDIRHGTIEFGDVFSGKAGTSVSLYNTPEPGYKIDYYIVNGERVEASTATIDTTLVLNENIYVTAVFVVDDSAVATFVEDDEAFTTRIIKIAGVVEGTDENRWLNDHATYDSLAGNGNDWVLIGDQLEYVEVHPGDALYAGDVLVRTTTLKEGAAPDNPSLYYTGASTATIVNGKQLATGAISSPAWTNYAIGANRTYVMPYEIPEFMVQQDNAKFKVEVTMTTANKMWNNPGYYDTSWYDESQTEFTLTTPQQLAGVAYLTTASGGKATFLGKTIKLGSDIDLIDPDSGVGSRLWWPISASSTYAFQGTFDGCGHTISNVDILSENGNTNSYTNYLGFIGYLGKSGSGGTVKNLTVEGDTTVYNKQYVGGIAGYAQASTVENCVNRVNIQPAAGATTAHLFGGIVGGTGTAVTTGCAITDCTNEGSITGVQKCGGIAGAYIGTMSGCTNVGTIAAAPKANSTYAPGGIIGYLQGNSTITKCINAGTVNGQAEAVVPAGMYYVAGGIVATAYSGITTISECANTGAINGNNHYAGGVVGRANTSATLTILDCYNAGEVSALGTGTVNNSTGVGVVGGVIGFNQSAKTTLRNCYDSGSVQLACAPDGDKYCYGALIGAASSAPLEMTNCHYLAGVCASTGDDQISGKIPSGKEDLFKADVFTNTTEEAFTLLNALNADRTGAEAVWTIAEGPFNNDGLPVFGAQVAETHSLTYLNATGDAIQVITGIPLGIMLANDQVRALFTAEAPADTVVPVGYDAGTLDGWVTAQNGEFPATVSNLPGDVVAWPHFDRPIHTYKVSYDANGGTLPEGIREGFTVADDYFELPIPEKEGYTFLGWYDTAGNRVIGIKKGTSSDCSVTAKWSDLNTYTVYYYSSQGLRQTLTVGYGHTVELGTFGDPDYTLIRFQKAPENVEALDYKVVYAMEDYNISKIKDDPDLGYDYVGYELAWQGPGNGDAMLTRQCGRPLTYFLVYDLGSVDASNGSNPSSYTVEDTVVFASPTREGYLFDGWLDDMGNPVTRLMNGYLYNGNDRVGVEYDESGVEKAKESLENITLTAVWKRDLSAATVTYDADSCRFTGYEVFPEGIQVVHDGTLLVEDYDYVVTFEDNIEIGTRAKMIFKPATAYHNDVAGELVVYFEVKAPTVSDAASGISVQMAGTDWLALTEQGYELVINVNEFTADQLAVAQEVMKGRYDLHNAFTVELSYRIVVEQAIRAALQALGADTLSDGATYPLNDGDYSDVGITVPLGAAMEGQNVRVLTLVRDEAGTIVGSKTLVSNAVVRDGSISFRTSKLQDADTGEPLEFAITQVVAAPAGTPGTSGGSDDLDLPDYDPIGSPDSGRSSSGISTASNAPSSLTNSGTKSSASSSVDQVGADDSALDAKVSTSGKEEKLADSGTPTANQPGSDVEEETGTGLNLILLWIGLLALIAAAVAGVIAYYRHRRNKESAELASV